MTSIELGAGVGAISCLLGPASRVPAMTVGGVGLFAAAATYLVGAAVGVSAG